MNRHERRKQASRDKRSETVRKLSLRAEREGYVIFASSPEHSEKLTEIQTRIMLGLDDISCWDGFSVMLGMTAFIAACGAHNRVDDLQVMTRETFLKNCAEKYDHYAEWQARHLARVNTDGGDA